MTQLNPIRRIAGPWAHSFALGFLLAVIAQRWGQPVVVENRPGAAGNIGAEAVYKADPDGYTLLSAPPPPLVINQNLYPKLGYDLVRDFAPISLVANQPLMLAVHPTSSARSVKDVIAMAQARTTQKGTTKLGMKPPRRRTRVRMPMLFCASLAPWENARPAAVA